MKIKVADLEPNPFRDFDCYPIDKERVDGLKDSIQKDTYWGGIPIRPHPTKKGKYQIGCGHHRLISLQESGIDEIDMPIQLFSDAQMLRVMINENAQYAARPKLVNSDVEKAKKFLDGLLGKYETWEKLMTAEINISGSFPKDPHRYGQLRKQGVGRPTILAYLGKPWAKRGWMIQEALALLKASEIHLDRQAVDTIPTMRQAQEFRKAVKEYQTPKNVQKKLAKEIVEKEIGRRDIPALLAKHSHIKSAKVSSCIQRLVEDIDNHSRTLYNKIMRLRDEMKQLDIKQLRGIKVWLTKSSLKQLFRELERLKGKDSL